MELIGSLIKTRSGKWVVEFMDGYHPHFYRYLFPLDPEIEVIEENVDRWDNLVAFSTRYYSNQLYAYIHDGN